MVDFYSQIPKITISTLLVAYFDSKRFENCSDNKSLKH